VRLWSLHRQYLDVKGLVAVWREAVLAQKVRAGDAQGYRNHPQLNRFKRQPGLHPLFRLAAGAVGEGAVTDQPPRR
jgi:hypothetical protein